MNYFFMNECIFKILIKNNKKFIINLLKSINILIEDYELFEINETSNIKTDILLFSKNLVINIELNKNKLSLTRNKIYIDCIKKLLPTYKVIQLNINLFKEKNQTYNNIKIYNLYKTNEYIKFITSKNYLAFKTNNKEINYIIKKFKKIDINLFKNLITKEEKIKNKVDNLIKE